MGSSPAPVPGPGGRPEPPAGSSGTSPRIMAVFPSRRPPAPVRQPRTQRDHGSGASSGIDPANPFYRKLDPGLQEISFPDPRERNEIAFRPQPVMVRFQCIVSECAAWMSAVRGPSRLRAVRWRGEEKRSDGAPWHSHPDSVPAGGSADPWPPLRSPRPEPFLLKLAALLRRSTSVGLWAHARAVEQIMESALPLDRMTTAEKLQMLEQLWADLCRTPGVIPSPDWHADILKDREKRALEGSSPIVFPSPCTTVWMERESGSMRSSIAAEIPPGSANG